MSLMKRPSKPKIGIIRGLMPRLTQAEFALSFKKFTTTFVTGEASDEIKDFCKEKKLKTYDLRLKKIYGIDPFGLLAGGFRHQSWIAPDKEKLLEVSRGLEILETYELYHFFSGQVADVARDLKIPLVVEVWTSFAHPAYFLPPYSMTVKKVVKQASLYVARSKKARRALLKLGIPKEKIKLIYHGVNITRFQSKFKSKKDDEKLVILYVGEMEGYKGVDDLLKVWPEIYKDYPTANLWLVGKGSLLERARGVSGVKVFGYIAYEKLPEIYRQADIFVSPSKNRFIGPFLWWEEFFSYTLMEAQAAGLPIIATRCGGIPEEIGDENLIVEQGDREGLKNALIKLIEDESLRKSIGLRNRKRAEKLFDLHKQTAVLERKIVEMLNRN